MDFCNFTFNQEEALEALNEQLVPTIADLDNPIFGYSIENGDADKLFKSLGVTIVYEEEV